MRRLTIATAAADSRPVVLHSCLRSQAIGVDVDQMVWKLGYGCVDVQLVCWYWVLRGAVFAGFGRTYEIERRGVCLTELTRDCMVESVLAD